MAINLGSAYGKVNLDASGVQRGVEKAKGSFKSLESSAQRLGQTLQNVGKAMTVAVTIPMAMMAKEAVMMASSYNESLNKVNVVFEESGKVIEDWSKDAAKNLGMSQQAALAAAGTYGNLFTAQGMGTKQAADMSMALVQLATDLASFNDANPEEVLLALRSGLSGEIEPLKKFGIAMNEATMKAKAMEMGLGDNIQALSEAEKIQVRYAIILQQTGKAQGDFARTSEGLANQLRTLKGNWGDTLKILGNNLVPIVEKVLQQLNKWLEWFNKADPKTQKFIATLLLIAFVAGPLLIIFGKLLPLAFSGATKSLSPLSGGIFGLIGTIVKWLGVAAMIVKVLTVLGFSTGPVGAAILSVNAAILGVGASILSIIGPVLLIIGTLAFLYWAFKTNFMGITTAAKQLWFIIKWGFAQMWAALKSGGAEALANLRAAWDSWVEQNKATFMGWVTWIQSAWERLLNYFAQVRDSIVQTFQNMNWMEVGRYIILGLANGILGGIPALIAAAIRAGKALKAAFDKELDIKSPSGEFEKRGVQSWQGYLRGWDKQDANSMAKSMASPVLNQNTSSQKNVTIQLANGLTLREAKRLLEQNNDQIFDNLSFAFGGM